MDGAGIRTVTDPTYGPMVAELGREGIPFVIEGTDLYVVYTIRSHAILTHYGRIASVVDQFPATPEHPMFHVPHGAHL